MAKKKKRRKKRRKKNNHNPSTKKKGAQKKHNKKTQQKNTTMRSTNHKALAPVSMSLWHLKLFSLLNDFNDKGMGINFAPLALSVQRPKADIKKQIINTH